MAQVSAQQTAQKDSSLALEMSEKSVSLYAIAMGI